MIFYIIKSLVLIIAIAIFLTIAGLDSNLHCYAAAGLSLFISILIMIYMLVDNR